MNKQTSNWDDCTDTAHISDVGKWPADGREGLFDDDNRESVWRKTPIAFSFTHNLSSDPCLHYEFELGLRWTRAAWFWQPFITCQFGKHRFQIGWLY